jgi:hypothetical protein
MILINSYFENERELWGDHVFCDDLARDEHFAGFKFSPVIARGSIAFNNSVGFTLKTLGLPDLRWPFNNDARYYNYGAWRSMSNMLNDDAVLYNSYHVLAAFHFHEKLWIRCAGGNKIFTGGVFSREEFERELDYMKQTNCDDTTFVIASPKKINKEYRCIFVDGRIVGDSLYMVDGVPCQNEHASKSLLESTQRWYDSQCFLPKHVVVDVTDSGKIIEINSLLTSGWYSADCEKVIAAIQGVYKTLIAP